MTRVNPYTKLRDDVLDVVRKWQHRKEHTVFSWAAPVNGERTSVPFPKLYYAIEAAQACGTRCTIEVDDKNLRVIAREKIDVRDMPHIYERGEIK